MKKLLVISGLLLNLSIDAQKELNLYHIGQEKVYNILSKLSTRELQEITRINLSSNNLTEITEQISRMPNLEELFVNNNAIRVLQKVVFPENIGWLDLSDNPLECWDVEIPVSLKWLGLIGIKKSIIQEKLKRKGMKIQWNLNYF